MSTDQEPKESAAERLKSFADSISYVYENYLALKRLAQALDGQSPAAPFPPGVAVTRIDIEYVTADAGRHTARIGYVTRVGDVAALLAAEIEKSIDSLRNLSFGAQQTSEQIAAACEAAQYSARAQQVGGPQ
jgi:hypothetical protein